MRSGRFPRRGKPGILAALLGAAAFIVFFRSAHGWLAQAAAELAQERRLPLLLAAACAVAVPATTAAAWRTVLGGRGDQLSFREAWGCYGMGCLANTVLPARLGEAVRIESFARRSAGSDRRLCAVGAAAAIGLGQSLVFGVVIALGAAGGFLPAWAAATLALPVAATLVALRWRRSGRLARVGIARAAWLRSLGWIGASSVARLGTAAAVLAALSAHGPVGLAFVAIGARALGGAVPFVPGGAVGAAAMAMGLDRAGLDPAAAAAAALSFHAIETAASLLFGGAGWLQLRSRPVLVRPAEVRQAVPADAW